MTRARRALVLAAALLALAACGARAEGPMALLSGGQVFYIGEHNWIYLAEGDAPLVREAARSLLYADGETLIYTTVDEKDLYDAPDAAFLRIAHPDLAQGDPATLAETSGDAVYVATDGAIYFARQGETAVSRYGVFTQKTEKAFSLQEAPLGMWETLDGLMVRAPGCRFVYLRGVNALTQVDADTKSVDCGARYETELDGAGALTARARGEKRGNEMPVDQGVLCCAQQLGALYYLKREGESCLLMRWTRAGGATRLTQTEALLPQLVSGEGCLYMLAQSGRVLRYDLQTQVLEHWARVGAQVASPLLAAAGSTVLVYDRATLGGAPAFAEMFSGAREEAQTDEAPREAAALSRGERGDLVRAAQVSLIRHGYLAGAADGVFGAKMELAVQYLQYDLGLSQDGMVSGALLRTILDDVDMPDFAGYVLLGRGDQGIRVADLQRRLRGLGYLAESADGLYGANTASAVERFESAVGFKRSGVATVALQNRLFQPDAPACDPGVQAAPADDPEPRAISAQDLSRITAWMNAHPGDTLNDYAAVARLQKRLRDLGYLESANISRVYDQQTWLAVRRYQEIEMEGLLPAADGVAGPETLEALFGTDGGM